MEFRYLRWHGWLVRYAVGGSKDPSDPALLLVHGFGASCDQWDEVFRAFSPSSSASQSWIPPANDEPAAGHATGEGGRSEQGATDVRRGTGVRLAALDLAGFGHSAKPPLTYSQYFWSDCARDVALRVIRGPFFVAGNSIGGWVVVLRCQRLQLPSELIDSSCDVWLHRDLPLFPLFRFLCCLLWSVVRLDWWFDKVGSLISLVV